MKRMFICAGMSVLMFLCIPVCGVFGPRWERMLRFVVAGTFWGSLLLEQILAIAGSRRLKKAGMKDLPIGIVTFGTSPEAMFWDRLLGGCALALAAVLLLKINSTWVVIISLSALLLSLQMHCILNGKNYRYLKQNQ